MPCHFCRVPLPADPAAAGWVPEWYPGPGDDDFRCSPVCPECAARELYVAEDGEYERREKGKCYP